VTRPLGSRGSAPGKLFLTGRQRHCLRRFGHRVCYRSCSSAGNYSVDRAISWAGGGGSSARLDIGSLMSRRSPEPRCSRATSDNGAVIGCRPAPRRGEHRGGAWPSEGGGGSAWREGHRGRAKPPSRAGALAVASQHGIVGGWACWGRRSPRIDGLRLGLGGASAEPGAELSRRARARSCRRSSRVARVEDGPTAEYRAGVVERRGFASARLGGENLGGWLESCDRNQVLARARPGGLRTGEHLAGLSLVLGHAPG